MNIFDKGFKEILASELASMFGGLVGGIFLAVYVDKIFFIPGMFILFPGFLDMRGNISGALASRLSSGLFLGIIDPSKLNTKIIRGNLLASFFLAMVVSLVLGTLAFLFSLIVFDIFVPKIILAALLAGIIANAIEVPLTLLATFYFFKKGHDPNNIIGPVITTSGDVISILSLLVAVFII